MCVGFASCLLAFTPIYVWVGNSVYYVSRPGARLFKKEVTTPWWDSGVWCWILFHQCLLRVAYSQATMPPECEARDGFQNVSLQVEKGHLKEDLPAPSLGSSKPPIEWAKA